MQNKPYKTGVICGRFQTIHKGHEILFETGLKLCDKLLILVGSSQESGTERNPYDVETRIEMLREIYGYGDNIIIAGLPDLTNENDISTDWGDYLMSAIHEHLGCQPEIMVYGNDESRGQWFSKETLGNTIEVIVNRSAYPVSATMVREAMITDDRETWSNFVNPKIHHMYKPLKEKLLKIDYYKEKASCKN